MNTPTVVFRLPGRILGLVLALVLLAIAAAVGPLPARAATGSVLFVVADADRPTAGETAVADHLTSTGLSTTLISDEDATPANASCLRQRSCRT